jgi:hypothetical protein
MKKHEQRSRYQTDYQRYTRREAQAERRHKLRTRAVPALILAAALGTLTYTKIESDNARHQVVEELSQPLPKVESEIELGKISPVDITIVRADSSGLVDAVIPEMLGPDVDPREVEAIVDAQTKDHALVKGQPFVVPVDATPNGGVQTMTPDQLAAEVNPVPRGMPQ